MLFAIRNIRRSFWPCAKQYREAVWRVATLVWRIDEVDEIYDVLKSCIKVFFTEPKSDINQSDQSRNFD